MAGMHTSIHTRAHQRAPTHTHNHADTYTDAGNRKQVGQESGISQEGQHDGGTSLGEDERDIERGMEGYDCILCFPSAV